MSLLIILWLAVLILGLLVWGTSATHPHQIIQQGLKSLPLNTSPVTSLLQKITRSKWLRPGWTVKRTTNLDKAKETIDLVQSPLSLPQFLSLKQLIWLSFVVLFWLYIWFGDVSWARSGRLLLLVALSMALPHLWLQVQKERHLRALNEEVPYFIDLLSLTLQTGLNIEQALQHVVGNKTGVMAQTIKVELKKLQLGHSLEQILQNLRQQIPNAEFQHFITSLLRAKKLGVSLSNTLQIQSELIRTKRRQKAEELSRTAAVKISLPLVLFIFPALLLIYIGPGLLNLMSQT